MGARSGWKHERGDSFQEVESGGAEDAMYREVQRSFSKTMPTSASRSTDPRQHSFVASRHDRSLYQFRMVGHDPNKLIVTYVPPSNILSICLLVLS